MSSADPGDERVRRPGGGGTSRCSRGTSHRAEDLTRSEYVQTAWRRIHSAPPGHHADIWRSSLLRSRVGSRKPDVLAPRNGAKVLEDRGTSWRRTSGDGVRARSFSAPRSTIDEAVRLAREAEAPVQGYRRTHTTHGECCSTSPTSSVAAGDHRRGRRQRARGARPLASRKRMCRGSESTN